MALRFPRTCEMRIQKVPLRPCHLAIPFGRSLCNASVWLGLIACQWLAVCSAGRGQDRIPPTSPQTLQWRALAHLPDPLGLAGPIVGVHADTLIVGGGANFPKPVWETSKRWHARLFLLNLADTQAQWLPAGNLAAPLAYAACASTPYGVVVVGGNDDQRVCSECWMLSVRGSAVEQNRLPDFPSPLVYAQAVWLENRVLVFGGQQGQNLESAQAELWELDLTDWNTDRASKWQRLPDCPGGRRAHHMLVPIGSGQSSQVMLIGGRRQQGQAVEFLRDCWKYDLAERKWFPVQSLPVAVSAGAAANFEDRTIAVFSGDDGALFLKTDELRDQHPGFPKRAWLYDLSSNRWSDGGSTPTNQVTTTPVMWRGRAHLLSGEVRPRVRTNLNWEIRLEGR
jgi:solute:Na+ symporter, SSS family